jgi:anti-sigma factor RsiW
MLSNDSCQSCDRLDLLRDYAFDELPAGERAAMERHIRECEGCARELDRLRMTTAALRVIPDQAIPQRIAFVSDKVFEPNWFTRFWNSGARLGFASACIVAGALVISAWHVTGTNQPAAAAPAIVQSASIPQSQIDQAIAKAVAQVRQEDAQMIQAALKASEVKHEREFQNQVVAMQESLYVQQKKLNRTIASMGSEYGVGQ